MAATASEGARVLAKLGASKGGRERAAALTDDQRSVMAREAALARWGDGLPRATHSGALQIGTASIGCAVLDNGKRLITQESFLTALGRDPRPKAGTGSAGFVTGLPPFLTADNVRPYVSDELRQAAVPIEFRTPERGTRAYGYDALIVPMVCEAFLDLAEGKKVDANGKKIKAHYTQKHIIEQCKMLIRGFARVGIVALVDEATGFQEDRAREELQKILELYVNEAFRPWVERFPAPFFREI